VYASNLVCEDGFSVDHFYNSTVDHASAPLTYTGINMSLKKLAIIASVIMSCAAIAAVVKLAPTEASVKEEKSSNFDRVMSDESAKTVSYY
jgi:hypothetical protein